MTVIIISSSPLELVSLSLFWSIPSNISATSPVSPSTPPLVFFISLPFITSPSLASAPTPSPSSPSPSKTTSVSTSTYPSTTLTTSLTLPYLSVSSVISKISIVTFISCAHIIRLSFFVVSAVFTNVLLWTIFGVTLLCGIFKIFIRFIVVFSSITLNVLISHSLACPTSFIAMISISQVTLIIFTFI